MRVLFVVTYFDCGGINRALQNLLNRIDTSRIEAEVFAMVPDGMFAGLYRNCIVLPGDRMLSLLMARYSQQKGLRRFLCLAVKLLDRLSGRRFGAFVKRSAAQKLSARGYDTVVAFSEGAPTAFVAMMKHPRSVAWIHCDYASYSQLNGAPDELGLYSGFSRIVCVADYPKKSFISAYPSLASRTEAVNNVQDVEMMRSMAALNVPEDFSGELFNIVSVGRLDPVKRLSAVPEIASNIAAAGCAFRWYVIGPKGGTLDEYEKLTTGISRPGLEGKVVYLGEKENPYAYISRADLLVNTSVSEACPYVVNEAKILHTPVVCTDFGSAREFVNDGVEGFIRPLEEIADTIVGYISDASLRERIESGVAGFSFDNSAILERVCRILGA